MNRSSQLLLVALCLLFAQPAMAFTAIGVAILGAAYAGTATATVVGVAAVGVTLASVGTSIYSAVATPDFPSGPTPTDPEAAKQATAAALRRQEIEDPGTQTVFAGESHGFAQPTLVTKRDALGPIGVIDDPTEEIT